MQITVGQLRTLLRGGIKEARIGASPEYMQKEKVREEMQDFIAAAVATGKIANQKQLDKFMAFMATESGASRDQELALTALKMIPFEVWQKLAKK